MKILFSTIALDAQPFISLIYAELRKLPKEIEWEWAVMEGTALPMHCTKWCAQQEPRLSRDGTTQYLESLMAFDRRVKCAANVAWDGKIAMVNAPLLGVQRGSFLSDKKPLADNDMEAWCLGQNRPPTNREMMSGQFQTTIKDEFLLWQIDSDEIWTAEQIVDCFLMFEDNPKKNAAFFWCRYFVGPDKVITTRNCFGNDPRADWRRVWKIKPGMLFKTHEPPVIYKLKLNHFTQDETAAKGLVFDHFAYATRAQVEFKEKYYAGQRNPNAKHYRGLLARWEKFQTETVWPRSLNQMFPWAGQDCMVNRI